MWGELRSGLRGCGLPQALRALGILAFAASTLACASSKVPPPTTTIIKGQYRVGPPDQLLITVLPEPAIEREVTVRPDGMISIDLVGDVPATGRTVEEIARDIEKRVARFKRDAVATVSVTLAQSATVTVFGEVRTQGSFALQRDTRVAEALGLQGGVTIYASTRRIRVVRTDGNKTTVLPVNLSSIQAGDLSTNLLLTEGDIIVVPPTVMAKIGYFLQNILFPFQPIFAVGQTALSASVFFR